MTGSRSRSANQFPIVATNRKHPMAIRIVPLQSNRPMAFPPNPSSPSPDGRQTPKPPNVTVTGGSVQGGVDMDKPPFKDLNSFSQGDVAGQATGSGSVSPLASMPIGGVTPG